MITTAPTTVPNRTRDIGIDLDTAELDRLLAEVFRVAKDEAPAIIAEAIRVDTLDRQSRGVGADGTKWHDYTKPYAKVRKKKGLQTSFVDHRVTGKMLDSYTFDAKDSMLTVPEELKGQAEGTSDLRNWVEPAQSAIDAGADTVCRRLEQVTV